MATRQQELRENTPVHDFREITWAEHSTLPKVPDSDVLDYRWVRTQVKGENDFSNVNKKINEKWTPVMADSLPKELYLPKMEFEGTQVIGTYGVVLMQRPKAISKMKKEYIDQMNRNQMDAVNNDLMRLKGSSVKSESKSSFTRGGRNVIVDD